MTTHTTAPTREAERAPEDAMREDIAKGIEEWTDAVGWDPEQVDMLITDFLAAAQPHLRARHRAELWAELIEAAEKGGEYYPTGELQIVVSWPYEEGDPLADWLRERQQADATRRDGGE